MIYYDVNDYGIPYLILSIFLHHAFDEFWTYWVHRWLHTYHKLYLKLHIVHHKSVDVTPFTGILFKFN